MKHLLAVLVFSAGLFFTGISTSEAATYVNGYYRSNGTYVQSHYRSSPDSTYTNNWSYQGNINPYTGSVGTRTYDSYRPSYNSYNSYRSYNSGYSSYRGY